MPAVYDEVFGALNEADTWFPSPAHLLRRSALLDDFSKYPPGKLLDMGCGAGRLLIDWQKLGHKGYGVDLDANARTLSRSCTDAFDAPFTITDYPPEEEKGTFDYLTIIEVLEHLENPLEALKEWSEYLKVGGIVMASVPAFQKKWGASDVWAGHVQRFEPEGFRKLGQDAGLSVRSVKLYGFPLGNLTRVAGNISSSLKMRGRTTALDRDEATLASGRDRSMESKVGTVLRSPIPTAILKAGMQIQRRYSDSNRGMGLVLIAEKTDP